jgi:hypothetical protein
MRCGPQRRVNLSATMRRSNCFEHRPGDRTGLDDRSVIGKPARKRAAHFDAVAGEHWNRSAARLADHPPSTIRRARRSRPSGAKGALT